jgi:predicted alpha/beta-fold hydrolase
MAQQLWQRGIRAVRMNMRGCGFGLGLAKGMAHSGRSEDILRVLESLHHETPLSSFALIGISLGGNQALKLTGELGSSTPTFLKQVIAICPPADLSSCAKLLSQPHNHFYDQHFVKGLKQSVLERHRLFPELGPVVLPENLSLYKFDDCYTAPQNEFCDAEDYYAKCSAAPFVPEINIPCQILFAADDPFIDGTVFAKTHLPSNIEIRHTSKGGHVGFLGSPFHKEGLHWLDAQLLAWLEL